MSILRQLIAVLSKLNGVNSRHAHKIAFGLLHNKDVLRELVELGEKAYESVECCRQCGVFTENRETLLCNICADVSRDQKKLCIVSNLTSLINLEKTKSFNGSYFLLGNMVSHIMGVMPSDVNLDKLMKLVREKEVEEVVIALNPTVEGQATAFHIRSVLNGSGVKVRSLGIGVPLGGDINVMDTQTLKAAMSHLVDM